MTAVKNNECVIPNFQRFASYARQLLYQRMCYSKFSTQCELRSPASLSKNVLSKIFNALRATLASFFIKECVIKNFQRFASYARQLLHQRMCYQILSKNVKKIWTPSIRFSFVEFSIDFPSDLPTSLTNPEKHTEHVQTTRNNIKLH